MKVELRKSLPLNVNFMKQNPIPMNTFVCVLVVKKFSLLRINKAEVMNDDEGRRNSSTVAATKKIRAAAAVKYNKERIFQRTVRFT